MDRHDHAGIGWSFWAKTISVLIIAVFVVLIVGQTLGAEFAQRQARAAPEWLKQGVIYQIWLRSFTPEGTLKSAAERLPWIRDLGATIVYLPPVQLADDDPREEFWSPRQRASRLNNPRNPYRIKDYDKIDPEYGPEADLRAFVEKAHQLGLRVLLDVVFYHCGPGSVLVNRPDFVKRNAEGKIVTGLWSFPLLNFDNPDLREYLWKHMAYYVEKFDVDGFRCDVADSIPLDFWEEARTRLEKIKPDIVMLAEGQNRPADQHWAFDINYSFTWASLGRAVVVGGEPAAVLREFWIKTNQSWPSGSRFIRFSSNHDLVNDQQHAEFVCGERGTVALTVINFTIDGVPFLYNGQEIGDTTPQSIYGRWPIRWETASLPKAVARYQLYQKLCTLRREESALSDGETVWLDHDQPDSAVAFLRRDKNSQIVTLVNLCNRPLTVTVQLPGWAAATFKDILANKGMVKASEGQLGLRLNAFDFFVGKGEQASSQAAVDRPNNNILLASTHAQPQEPTTAEAKSATSRPNILWLTLEDVNCHFGCYGDSYATTPNIDRLAREGIRYTNAIAGASVCTPCRSTLITGMYAVTLGSQHLRSPIRLPKEVQCFPELLRQAGYYCTNNVKQDYNFECPPGVWDESSPRAHWRNRPEGRPFFAVFNTMVTHQSRVRMSDEEFAKEIATLEPVTRHDPATVPLPPYYPDTPGVRKEMARYYDMISAADKWIGKHLQDLAGAGLEEDTIVFVFGDNGAGLPRHKRALYDTGVRVPLLVRFPKKFAHLAPAPAGSVVSQVVSFVDFAPTVLRLAGVEPPELMQGQAFLGAAGAARPHAYLFRDRVDEVFELSRGVRDRQFKYIRNFMPHRPYMEISEYCEPAQMVRDLRRLAAEGRLSGPTALYLAQTKPIEELYDLENDPHELNNLAADTRYTDILQRMRQKLRNYVFSLRDTGFLPESDMFRRAGDQTIWEMAQDDEKYPLARIFEAADAVGHPEKSYQDFEVFLADTDPAVRYWGVIGLMSMSELPQRAISRLHQLLDDNSPEVRIVSAEALCRFEKPEKAVPVLAKELRSSDPYVRLLAASTLAVVNRHAAGARDSVLETIGEKGSGDMWMFTQWALARCCRQLNWPIPPHVPTQY